MNLKIFLFLFVSLYVLSCNKTEIEPETIPTTKVEILKYYSWEVYKIYERDIYDNETDITNEFISDSRDTVIQSYYDNNIFRSGKIGEIAEEKYWFTNEDTTEIYYNTINSLEEPIERWNIQSITTKCLILFFPFGYAPAGYIFLLKPINKKALN